MSFRSAVSSVVLLAMLAGCGDPMSPLRDLTQPQAISLGPPSTVPLLAASAERIYMLRGVDATSVDVEGRRLDGSSRWKVRVTSCQEFCFLAVDADDNVYYTTAAGVISVTGSSGKTRWSVPIPGAIVAVGSGGSSRVYVASRPFAVPQRAYSLDAASGGIVWSTSLLPSLDVTALLVDESRSFVYAIGRGRVSVINLASGGVVRTSQDVCFAGSQGAIASDGTVYVTCDNTGSSRLTALAPGGILKWTTGLNSATGSSAPVIDAAGTIYVSNRTSLTALNPDGTKLWELGDLTGNVVSPAVGSNKDVYIHASHPTRPASSLLVVNNGSIVDNKETVDCGHSILLTPGGRLYCGSSGGFAFFQTTNTDLTSQWSQLGSDAQRGSRKR